MKKKPKAKTKSWYVKKLDKVFSEYIRQKYADSFGMVSCFTCDARKHWKDMQNGHFISYHPKYHKEIHIINITRESLTEDIMNAQEKLAKFEEKYNQTVMKLL